MENYGAGITGPGEGDKMTFTKEQQQIIAALAWVAIKNGNSVTKSVFDPTPAEYRELCAIVSELNQVKTKDTANNEHLRGRV